MGLLKVLKFIALHPLNRRGVLSAVLRFLRYQVATRLFKSKVLVDWVDDTKILISRGETGLTGNLYCGLMEYEDMSFLLHHSDQSDVLYDIGANVGAYTILASGVNKMKSIALEPLPSTFDRLIDQIKINRIDHLVEAKNIGVGNDSGVLEFTNNMNCMNRVNTDPSNTDITKVEVVTLDSHEAPTGPSIVKIDVEGYEKFVLEGGTNFFSSPHVVALIVELNGSGVAFGVDDANLHKMITSFGFQPISYDPFNRKIALLDTYENGGNTIYVKNVGDAQRRVSDSPSFCIRTANGLVL